MCRPINHVKEILMKIRKALIASLAAAVGAAGFISATTANAETVPHNPAANQPAYWVSYFNVEGIECSKTDPAATPYVLGDAGDDREWFAVVVKAGAGDDAHEVFRNVTEGQSFSHSTGKDNSHVITCTVPANDEPSESPKPTEPGESPKPTEPTVTPTDQPTKPGDDDDDDDDDKGKPKPVKPGKPGKPGLPKTGR